MKFIIIILLLVSSVCFGQKDDKSKPQTTSTVIAAPTDSTGLLTLKDVQALAKYLEDKLLAKDYNLVIGALNQLISERAKEFQKPKNK